MGACLALIGTAAPVTALETSLTAPGADEKLQDRLRAASLTLSADARGLKSSQEILAAARSDYRGLISILYDEGYYGPVINIRVDGREAAHINPLQTPAVIRRVDIAVQPGRPFVFGKAEIGPLPPETDLPTEFRTGEPAPSGVLQSTTRVAIDRWRAVGHAKATVSDQQITARHADAVLDAEIGIAPGPLLRFGEARLTQESYVRPDAIYRIAGFPTGEQFSPEAARKAAGRLRRTGAFSSVSLREADQPNPDGTLDFELETADAKKRRLQFGAEVSSEQGVELSFLWVHRNLFGGAERLTFDSRLRNIGGTSDLDGRIVVRLDRPAFFGADNDLFYLFDVELKDEDHYNLLRGSLGVGWRRVLSDHLYFETAIAANYNLADDVFGSNRRFRFLALPSRLRWDTRDNKTDATRGIYLNVDAAPFAGLKGTASGLYGYVDGRAYYRVGSDSRVVLAGRLQLGTVLGAQIQDISPDQLFYSGGSGTVRGQPYQSLGVPINGGTAGGRSFLGLSAEIRTKVTDQFSVVGFFDYGAVDSSAFVSSGSPSHAGAGLGLRYDVGGFGALRLDLAMPTQGTTGDGLQFYFGIGQAF